jgi:hypothetical protein
VPVPAPNPAHYSGACLFAENDEGWPQLFADESGGKGLPEERKKAIKKFCADPVRQQTKPCVARAAARRFRACPFSPSCAAPSVNASVALALPPSSSLSRSLADIKYSDDIKSTTPVLLVYILKGGATPLVDMQLVPFEK